MEVRWIAMEERRVDFFRNVLNSIMEHSSFAIAIMCRS